MAWFTDDFNRFFKDLAKNNHKEWFDANRKRYEASVKQPFHDFVLEVIRRVHAVDKRVHIEPKDAIFRINRDIRFSADKRPYKTQQAALIDRGARGTLYVSVDADGIMVGCGTPHLDSAQVARWRAAVAGEPGEELADLVARLRRSSYVVGTLGREGITAEGDLKRVPKPYPADHPRADLLRLKALVAARSWQRPAWLGTRRTLTEVRRAWTATEPLADWLGTHVGPPTT